MSRIIGFFSLLWGTVFLCIFLVNDRIVPEYLSPCLQETTWRVLDPAGCQVQTHWLRSFVLDCIHSVPKAALLFFTFPNILSLFTLNTNMSFSALPFVCQASPAFPTDAGDGCVSNGTPDTLHPLCCPGSCCWQHGAWFVCWICHFSRSFQCLSPVPSVLQSDCTSTCPHTMGFGVWLFYFIHNASE